MKMSTCHQESFWVLPAEQETLNSEICWTCTCEIKVQAHIVFINYVEGF